MSDSEKEKTKKNEKNFVNRFLSLAECNLVRSLSFIYKEGKSPGNEVSQSQDIEGWGVGGGGGEEASSPNPELSFPRAI